MFGACGMVCRLRVSLHCGEDIIKVKVVVMMMTRAQIMHKVCTEYDEDDESPKYAMQAGDSRFTR